MASRAREKIQADLRDFGTEAENFGTLANQLAMRGIALARNPVERARVVQMIERAKLIQKGVMIAKESLSEVKSFLGEVVGERAAHGKIFVESSDTVIRGVTKALRWFNRDCDETLARLEAGTLGVPGSVKVGGLLTVIAAGGVFYLNNREAISRTLKRIGV